MSEEADEFVPEEIEDECTQCHKALAAVERMVKPAVSLNRAQLEDKLSPMDSASLLLLLTYTMNSLFWVYLSTHGINPKTHLIKGELERIQKVMQRSRNVTERQKGTGVRLNKSAAKRFVRGALWDSSPPGQDDSDVQVHESKRKRKLDNTDVTDPPRTKKIHKE